MAKATDITAIGTSLYFLPVRFRVPLKFGTAVMTHAICARVRMKVRDVSGNTAEGWGETPIAVGWSWPGSLSFDERQDTMLEFCKMLAEAWAGFDVSGHPMEIGHEFQNSILKALYKQINDRRGADAEPMPWLAALICCSVFDIALHDAYGILHNKPVYQTYNAELMNADLSAYLEPAPGTAVAFEGKYPQDYFVTPPQKMPAWHLVGGLDPLDESELTGNEPDDGYPVMLRDWIERDGLICLKIKLRGTDAEWDYNRIVKVGRIAVEKGTLWLTADFNCTVTDPAYVTDILDRLLVEHPRIYGMILYVEQPFPYELEQNQIDVHSVSARKPLFMDESAHDWHLVKLGRSLGWTGVALKTCKTQTGALLSLCWAKAHGMTLMVQDLTNPMLAIMPHVLLAAHAGTIMGVECNAMQFHPEASLPEEEVHPGLHRRRGGMVDLATVCGAGFGYRVSEIKRDLPECVANHGE